ncbi:MAG: AAA family ATPase [Galbitalea sp.]
MGTATLRHPYNDSHHQAGTLRPMVGRNDALTELLTSVGVPHSATLIVGDPGAGRSTLLEAVRTHAPIRCAWVAPHPSERERQLAGISMVLNAIGDPRVAEFIGRFQLADDSVNGTLAAALDLLLLLRAGKREEILVLIDDADKFDEHSKLTLAYLAGRLAGTGLRMAIAVTPEAASSTFAGIRSVSIPRLDAASAMELARAVAAPDADPQTLAIVCQASAGLPGMITASLDHLTGDQLEGLAPLTLPLYPGPEPLEFESGEPETVLLLRRLSTAPLRSLSALPDIRDGNRGRFEQLASQGVLELSGPFVSIRDGALRSALYWSMTSEQRQELHRAAAAEEAGHCTAIALWHLDHVDDAPEGSRALISEATELYERGFVDAATELIERALLLSPGLEGLIDVLLELCNRLIIQSEFGLARRYLTQCGRAAREPAQLADCLRLEVTIDSLTEDEIEVGAIDLFARRYEKDSPEASAELLSFAAVSLAANGKVDAARSRVDAAYAIHPADRVSTRSVQNWARRYIDGIDGAGTGTGTTRQPEPDVEELPIPAQLVSGRALSMEERYDDARRTFGVLTLAVPHRARTSAWAARVLALSAENEIRAGRIPDASRLIDTLADVRATDNFRSALLFAWSEIMVHDHPAPEPFLEEAREFAAGSRHSLATAQLLALEGSSSLMRGDLDEAKFQLGRAYETTLGLRPDFLRVEGDFIEVLARRGEWDAAGRVTERFAERANRHPSRWSLMVLARSRAIVAPRRANARRIPEGPWQRPKRGCRVRGRAHAIQLCDGTRTAWAHQARTRPETGRRVPLRIPVGRGMGESGARIGDRRRDAGAEFTALDADRERDGRAEAHAQGHPQQGHRHRALRVAANRRGADHPDLSQARGAVAIAPPHAAARGPGSDRAALRLRRAPLGTLPDPARRAAKSAPERRKTQRRVEDPQQREQECELEESGIPGRRRRDDREHEIGHDDADHQDPGGQRRRDRVQHAVDIKAPAGEQARRLGQGGRGQREHQQNAGEEQLRDRQPGHQKEEPRMPAVPQNRLPEPKRPAPDLLGVIPKGVRILGEGHGARGLNAMRPSDFAWISNVML